MAKHPVLEPELLGHEHGSDGPLEAVPLGGGGVEVVPMAVDADTELGIVPGGVGAESPDPPALADNPVGGANDSGEHNDVVADSLVPSSAIVVEAIQLPHPVLDRLGGRIDRERLEPGRLVLVPSGA